MQRSLQETHKTIQMKIFHLIVLTFTVFSLSAKDWNQWRGPNRDGVVEGKKWPATLNESNLKLRWRLKLGSSYSGALMDSDTVYVTESTEGNYRPINCKMDGRKKKSNK